jgi:malate dehydrogenase (decarboxylating)
MLRHAKLGGEVFTGLIHSSSRKFTKGIRDELMDKYLKIEIVRNKGSEILNDPISNQTLAFDFAERDRLNIRGLLPPTVLTMDQQAELLLQEYEFGVMEMAARSPDDETLKSGVTPKMIRQWKVLQSLQDRDETLFYYLLTNNIKAMAPVVYTPTVGWVCKNYSKMFRRPRGMFITANDKGQIASVLENWSSQEIDAIVVTDGSRILGLGDLGIGGLGISIGKLDLYVAAGGFHPNRILPVVIDVGTNNESLLNDPTYLGLKRNRLHGQEYYDLIDEFMAACAIKWPKALIQFEDFELKHALNLLERYRDEFLIFNDDIQGTASIVLAGIIGALKIQNQPITNFIKQKFVVVGAGSAGMGVVHSIHLFLQRYGLTKEEAAAKFHVLDYKGLITQKRSDISARVQPFARSEVEDEGMDLHSVIKKYKPTCLIGLSGTGGLFTKDVIESMNHQPEGILPIIFPLSNPNSKAECTAEDVQKYTNNNAIFGSGSPFEDLVIDGKIVRSNQVNNVYIYPGLALGAFLGDTKIITDSMIVASAEALSETIPEADYEKRSIYPCLSTIREISVHIAARVMEQADKERRLNNSDAKKALNVSFEHLKNYIRRKQWKPIYKPLVYVPHGIR